MGTTYYDSCCAEAVSNRHSPECVLNQAMAAFLSAAMAVVRAAEAPDVTALHRSHIRTSVRELAEYLERVLP